jgi:hypothetical protein
MAALHVDDAEPPSAERDAHALIRECAFVVGPAKHHRGVHPRHLAAVGVVRATADPTHSRAERSTPASMWQERRFLTKNVEVPAPLTRSLTQTQSSSASGDTK